MTAYICDNCGYVTNRKCNLESHKNRKRPCKYSNNNNKSDHGYSRLDDIDSSRIDIESSRIDIESLEVDIESFECKYCKCVFNSKKYLKQHESKHCHLKDDTIRCIEIQLGKEYHKENSHTCRFCKKTS